MELQEYVATALSSPKRADLVPAVTAILDVARWDTTMLSDPAQQQLLIAVLEKPWQQCQEGKAVFGLGDLEPEQLDAVNAAAVVIAARLVGSAVPRKRRQVDPILAYSKIKAPSTFANIASNTGSWRDSQMDPTTPIMCLRPNGMKGVPISLMCPVFQTIQDILRTGTPSYLDLITAEKLCSFMPNAFSFEGERRNLVIPVFQELLHNLDVSCLSLSIANKTTDFSVMLNENTMILNLEMKNEKGNGNCDPYMENVGYYVHYCVSQGSSVSHCRPVLLVELLGQEMGLSGAVWSQYPTIQPLSDNVPFLDASRDSELYFRQARLVCAIRVGVEHLAAYYRQTRHVSSQCLCPYLRSFDSPSGRIDFTYERLLIPDDLSKLLYLAARDDTGDKLVIKFCCDGYGREAHEYLASRGFAPKLLGFQSVGAFHMVVMEFVEGDMWIGQRHASQYWETFESTMGQFHQAGFVHGDLRHPNILVSKDGPKILDFDWAGRIGEPIYPRVLNRRDIRWPTGAVVRALITIEHDIFMLEQLKTDVEVADS
jgi:hypothetical protein